MFLSIARWLMASRGKAYITLIALALISTIIKPVGILVSAGVALVTLTIGLQSSIVLAILSSFFVGMLNMIFGQSLLFNVGIYVGIFVVPVIGSALILKYKSIELASLGLAVWAATILVLAKLWMPDLNLFWYPLIQNYSTLLQLNLAPEEIEILSKTMNAGISLMVFIMPLLGLLLGKYWQTRLYQPGEFAEIFQQWFFGNKVASALIIIIALAIFDNQLANDLIGIILALFVLQGIALIHYIWRIKAFSKFWLYAFYPVIFIFSEAMLLLAFTGLIDNWANIRKRLQH